MFPFDVILFDVGGVLLTNGWDHNERAQAVEQFHLDAAEFETRHLATYDAWERDLINIWTYLDGTVFYEARSFSPQDFFQFMLSLSKPLPSTALGILAEVAASHNYMVGALNNEARETNEYRFRKFGLLEHFEVAFSSCYLGLRKPNPAIYKRAIDILGKPPERILFIDDRQENVDGATGAGMKALRFDGADLLRKDLTALGILQP
jgi:putative hydrolase of the HAD superfamily